MKVPRAASPSITSLVLTSLTSLTSLPSLVSLTSLVSLVAVTSLVVGAVGCASRDHVAPGPSAGAAPTTAASAAPSAAGSPRRVLANLGLIPDLVDPDDHASPQPARPPGMMLGKAWLGVELRLPESGKGVLAKHVIRTSPAEKAGLRDGDVILTVEKQDVSRPSDVISVVQGKAPGEGVDLTFVRGTAESKARVTLGVFPDSGDMLKLDKVNTFAPSLGALTSIQGSTPLDLSKLRGKVVLVDFWAGWCGVCRMTTPIINAWAAKYGAQGLVVIGVTSDEPSVASKATRGFGITYTVGADTSGDAMKAYGVSALPTMFLIDKAGVIRDLTVGLDTPTAKAIEDAIVKQLAAP